MTQKSATYLPEIAKKLNQLYSSMNCTSDCVLVHKLGPSDYEVLYVHLKLALSEKRDCSPKIYLSTYFCSRQLSQERNHHQ